MNHEELNSVFRQAAEKALSEWLPQQWDRQKYEADDLSQDLWLWYLERPGTKRKMESLSEPEAVQTAFIHAMQILSQQVMAGNTFRGRDLYSGDSVREALRGESTNKYLIEILPFALKNLESRNQEHAEAIRRRYDDGEVSTVPSEKMVLSRAVKSVTEDVNVTYLTADDDCAGASAVFPETRKQRGGYADPTGNTVVLLDENPEYRYHFYEETPMQHFLGGAASQPALEVGKIKGRVVGYRRAGST